MSKKNDLVNDNEAINNLSTNNNKKNSVCKILIILLIGVIVTLFVLECFKVIDVVFEINPYGYSEDVCEEECSCNDEVDDEEIPFYEQITSEKEKKKYLKKLCKIELDYEEMYYNSQTYDANDLDENEFMDEKGLKPAEMCFNGACLIVDKKQNMYMFDCYTEEYAVQSFDEVVPNLSLNTACSVVDNNGDYLGDDNLYCDSYVCTYDYNGKKYEKDCRE